MHVSVKVLTAVKKCGVPVPHAIPSRLRIGYHRQPEQQAEDKHQALRKRLPVSAVAAQVAPTVWILCHHVPGFAAGFGVHGTCIFCAAAIAARPTIALAAAATCALLIVWWK